VEIDLSQEITDSDNITSIISNIAETAVGDPQTLVSPNPEGTVSFEKRGDVIDELKKFIDDACHAIGEAAKKVWEGIKAVASAVWDGIKAAYNFIKEQIEKYIFKLNFVMFNTEISGHSKVIEFVSCSLTCNAGFLLISFVGNKL
jgi:hypothetical protein